MDPDEIDFAVEADADRVGSIFDLLPDSGDVPPEVHELPVAAPISLEPKPEPGPESKSKKGRKRKLDEDGERTVRDRDYSRKESRKSREKRGADEEDLAGIVALGKEVYPEWNKINFEADELLQNLLKILGKQESYVTFADKFFNAVSLGKVLYKERSLEIAAQMQDWLKGQMQALSEIGEDISSEFSCYQDMLDTLGKATNYRESLVLRMKRAREKLSFYESLVDAHKLRLFLIQEKLTEPDYFQRLDFCLDRAFLGTRYRGMNKAEYTLYRVKALNLSLSAKEPDDTNTSSAKDNRNRLFSGAAGQRKKRGAGRVPAREVTFKA